MTWQLALMMLPGLIIGLTVHEFAHAWSASLLGDQFPRRQGRVSLNPLRHLSPLGTLAIFLLGFGWGRPVMTNLYNFRNPKRDFLICSLAGPAANIIVVLACLGLMLLTRYSSALGQRGEPWLIGAHEFLTYVVIINIILATLNLLPIPPLDGSKIWPCLIPGARATMSKTATWVSVAVLVVLLSTNSLSPLIHGVIGHAMVLFPSMQLEQFSELRDKGRSEFAGGNLPAALDCFERAVRLRPWSSESYCDIALVRQKQEDWPAAVAAMDKAIQYAPARAEYYEMRAGFHVLAGNAKQAQEDIAKAGELRVALGILEPTTTTNPTTATAPAAP